MALNICMKKIINTFKSLDAIFYSNDMMARGGMKILLRHGYKVPRDVAIIGFDNIHISEVIEPELTTIAQPIYIYIYITIMELFPWKYKLIFYWFSD